ncbi:putative nucleocapsid protein [Perilla mosaic virus]|uniref:Putative nucleocapsid protein n=1 Tax=Perilla mosaic virus TaxID=2483037 RepID=A0A6F8PH62_9VIRU|nr:putative nucleocapsid protein [Perilla mosaic virus]BBM96180.1 putative nucleocapsid protein [Perilla mosaic virus]
MSTKIKRYSGKTTVDFELKKSSIKEFKPTGITPRQIIDFKPIDYEVNSKELKNLYEGLLETKIESQSRDMEIDFGSPSKVYIIHNLANPGGDMSILSFSKYSAILGYCAFKTRYAVVFDWKQGVYVSKGIVKPQSLVNRLAESIGLRDDSRLYLLYVQGVEFLFELLPEEALAISLWKANNAERIGLKGTKEENAKNIIAKIVKVMHKHELGQGVEGCKKVLSTLNKATILGYYKELNDKFEKGGLSVSYSEIFNELSNQFSSLF